MLWLVAPAVGTDHGQCSVTVSPGDDLQEAIDRVQADGAPANVCLGAGEFRFHRFVSIARDDVRLHGEGPSTILRADEGTQGPLIVIGDYEHATPQRVVSNVVIERLRVIGGGSGGSEFDSAHPYLTNSAVVVRAGRNIAIRKLDVTACRSACILTELGSRDVSIEDNAVGGSVWDGISLNRTSKARLVGNAIHGNTAAGITTEHLEDSVIRNNVVTGNKTHGLYLSDSYRNTIRGNRFSENVLSGILLTCAVRYRAPVVQCWNDSMSRGNAFERNEFIGNRVAFMVAADGAANCMLPGFVPNLSRGDLFSNNPREGDSLVSYGRCMLYDGQRSG